MTNWDHAKRGIEWVDGKFGTYGILKRYGIAPSDELLDHFRVLNRQIGKIIELAPRDLPPLVTFANINDPSSILPVDPQNISDALDQDVTWKRITFEITNEAVTRQIKKRLPWFDAYASKNFAGRKSSSRDVHPLLNESTALFTW